MNIVVLSLLLLLVFSCCFALHMLLQQNKTKWPQTRACTFDFLGTHRNKLKRFVRSTGWPWSAVCHRLPDYRKSSTWGRLVILLLMHLNLRHKKCESDWYNLERHDSSCDPLSLHVQVSLKPSIQMFSSAPVHDFNNGNYKWPLASGSQSADPADSTSTLAHAFTLFLQAIVWS